MSPLSPVRRCVTILLPPGASLAPGGLRLLLRYAHRCSGSAPWAGAVADVFAAKRGTLLVVRPALTAELADYALPYVYKYFNL